MAHQAPCRQGGKEEEGRGGGEKEDNGGREGRGYGCVSIAWLARRRGTRLGPTTTTTAAAYATGGSAVVGPAFGAATAEETRGT